MPLRSTREVRRNRNLGTREPDGGELSGFSFCIMYPRPGAEKSQQPAHANGQRQNQIKQTEQTKKLAPSTKGIGKGQSTKTENF